MEERARIQGLFSSIWGVSSLVGPLAGAFLTMTAGWRSIFLRNPPLGPVARVDRRDADDRDAGRRARDVHGPGARCCAGGRRLSRTHPRFSWARRSTASRRTSPLRPGRARRHGRLGRRRRHAAHPVLGGFGDGRRKAHPARRIPALGRRRRVPPRGRLRGLLAPSRSTLRRPGSAPRAPSSAAASGRPRCPSFSPFRRTPPQHNAGSRRASSRSSGRWADPLGVAAMGAVLAAGLSARLGPSLESASRALPPGTPAPPSSGPRSSVPSSRSSVRSSSPRRSASPSPRASRGRHRPGDVGRDCPRAPFGRRSATSMKCRLPRVLLAVSAGLLALPAAGLGRCGSRPRGQASRPRRVRPRGLPGGAAGADALAFRPILVPGTWQNGACRPRRRVVPLPVHARGGDRRDVARVPLRADPRRGRGLAGRRAHREHGKLPARLRQGHARAPGLRVAGRPHDATGRPHASRARLQRRSPRRRYHGDALPRRRDGGDPHAGPSRGAARARRGGHLRAGTLRALRLRPRPAPGGVPDLLPLHGRRRYHRVVDLRPSSSIGRFRRSSDELRARLLDSRLLAPSSTASPSRARRRSSA